MRDCYYVRREGAHLQDSKNTALNCKATATGSMIGLTSNASAIGPEST